MDGFDFQMDLFLCKLPYWLSIEGFTSFISEGIGDGEAKFFLPSEGVKVELVQVKNHYLFMKKFREVIYNFKDIDEGNPGMYRWFTLCCDGVSKEIKSLLKGLKRLRNSQSFYQGSEIYRNSYEDYKKRALYLGIDEKMADFLYQKVFIEPNWNLLSVEEESIAENVAKSIFQDQLKKHFRIYRKLLSEDLDKIYYALKELLRENRARTISRIQIEKTIQTVIEEEYNHYPIPQKPTIITTGIGVKQEVIDKGICFNCSAFFGGEERDYPPKEEWNSKLVKELRDTKEWIIRHRNTQHIRLEGRCRLSVAFAIGYVFSEVAGFTIEMEHQNKIWLTSYYPADDVPDYPLSVEFQEGTGDRLVVAIGITPINIGKAVKTYLERENLCDLPILCLSSSQRILSDQANLVVDKIKSHILNTVYECGAKHVDLFYAGPATIALFLGHRWNPIHSVQCYEYISKTGKYVPTCQLGPQNSGMNSDENR